MKHALAAGRFRFPPAPVPATGALKDWKTMEIEQLDPEKVKDNPYQPRKSYSSKKIEEIASSIEQNGLLETPVGRRRNGDIELAFGHVRKRSFIKLKKKSPKKWSTMPVEIREISDNEMIIFALEENLKRSDITPIDMARSITMYFEVFPDATEVSLAKKLTMTQGNISNMRRVTRLPVEVLAKIDEGRISFTMARELLIFEGLTAPGADSRYSRKEDKYVDIAKDSKWLMLSAVKLISTPGTTGRYGSYSPTVEGMQKAIHSTVSSNFRPLGTSADYGYVREEVLFDVEKAGCKKCESMVKTHPTKSGVCYYCTKTKCWEKKQSTHKAKRAAEAKKKMQEDILHRAAEAEKERQAKTDISQEIAAEDDIVDYIPEDERKQARERIREIKGFEGGREWPCRTCLSVGHCDRSSVYSVDGAGDTEILKCDEYMGKGDARKVREKATLEVPPELVELAKEKAGSRAEILDLNELGGGYYSSDLKQGYVLMDRILDSMDKPEECLETCTKGFHFAYNSKERPYWAEDRKTEVSYVCTNPKCVSQKKAAYTRAVNAAGQAKKKAEYAAIKQAVDATTSLDKARIIIIIDGILHTDDYPYSSRNSDIAWFAKKLKIDSEELDQTYGSAAAKIRKALKKKLKDIAEEDIARILLEFSLVKMAYSGEIKDYKIQTTEALNSLSIGVNIDK